MSNGERQFAMTFYHICREKRTVSSRDIFILNSTQAKPQVSQWYEIEFSDGSRYNHRMVKQKRIESALLIIVLGAWLAACSPTPVTGAPATRVPTETPRTLSGIRVSTLPPPATNTLIPATATPIPPTLVTQPSATPGCVLSAAFVADVTIPDGSNIAPGSQFVKTWRIKNSGTCDWNAVSRAVFVEGNQLDGPAAVSIPPTDAGGVRDVSMTLTAPSAPGTYKGKWQVRTSSGAVLTGLTVSIVVEGTPTPAVTASPTAKVKPTPVPTFDASIDSFVGLWLVDDGMRGFATDTQRLQQLQIEKSGNQLKVSPVTTFGSPYQFGLFGFTSASYSGGPRMQWEFDDPTLGHVSIAMGINKLCNARVRLAYPGFSGTFIVYQPICQVPGQE
jgi:hypothetical protein